MVKAKRWWSGFLITGLLSCGLVSGEEGSSIVPDKEDVVYGDHPRNRLDFYRAESETPTPVYVYFHGGGFVQGDKQSVKKSKLTRMCLENGISVVSANYRFVRDRDGVPGEPFPGSLLDGARVVQFVRFRARDWNVDPDRILLAGSSAGGLMSVWLALQDDLADPDSEDPVLRESTRVLGVYGSATQTTLDPDVILSQIGGNPRIHGSAILVYGATSMEEVRQMPEKVRAFSALNFVSPDDPPLYLRYSYPLAGTPLSPDTSTSVSIHHPMFGKLMCDRYAKLGLECVLSAKDQPAAESSWTFIRRILRETETGD